MLFSYILAEDREASTNSALCGGDPPAGTKRAPLYRNHQEVVYKFHLSVRSKHPRRGYVPRHAPPRKLTAIILTLVRPVDTRLLLSLSPASQVLTQRYFSSAGRALWPGRAYEMTCLSLGVASSPSSAPTASLCPLSTFGQPPLLMNIRSRSAWTCSPRVPIGLRAELGRFVGVNLRVAVGLLVTRQLLTPGTGQSASSILVLTF